MQTLFATAVSCSILHFTFFQSRILSSDSEELTIITTASHSMHVEGHDPEDANRTSLSAKSSNETLMFTNQKPSSSQMSFEPKDKNTFNHSNLNRSNYSLLCNLRTLNIIKYFFTIAKVGIKVSSNTLKKQN